MFRNHHQPYNSAGSSAAAGSALVPVACTAPLACLRGKRQARPQSGRAARLPVCCSCGCSRATLPCLFPYLRPLPNRDDPTPAQRLTPLVTPRARANNIHRLREKYNLEEAPCSDCCVHCLASPCALCQEAREISRRAGAPTGAGTPAYYPTTHQPPPAVAMTAQPYPPAHYPPSMPPSAPAAPSPGGYYPSVPNAPPVQYGAMYGGRM